MELRRKNYPIQKKTYHFFILIVAFIMLTGCSKDDGPNVQPLPINQEETENKIYGQWNVLSGNLSFRKSKFIHFNVDNTMHLLEEDDLGFRTDLISPIETSENEIIIVTAEQGSRSVRYQIEDDKLIIHQEFGDRVVLEKSSIQIPTADEWIKTLSIQSKGDVSLGRVDIAFDGEYVLGYDEAERVIQKINPNSFEITDAFDGGEGIVAIDVEKSDFALRQLFKATDREGAYGFSSYIYTSDENYYYSNGIEVAITGLASEKPGYIWAASSHEKELYYYKSNGSLRPGEVLQPISLDISPSGLDYRDDYLYIASGNYIYKCNTLPEFSVEETFKLNNFSIRGITYDGSNFILNVYDLSAETYKLLKINLSI